MVVWPALVTAAYKTDQRSSTTPIGSRAVTLPVVVETATMASAAVPPPVRMNSTMPGDVIEAAEDAGDSAGAAAEVGVAGGLAGLADEAGGAEALGAVQAAPTRDARNRIRIDIRRGIG